MSADPVTMYLIASTAMQVTGKMAEIRQLREAAALRKQSYELEMKMATLKGEQEANDRTETMLAQKANNLAIVAGSGYQQGSPHFQNIQFMTKKIADKDIGTIRLNTTMGLNKLSLAAQAEQSQYRAQVFGGYVSIISTGMTTHAKISKIKYPEEWKNVDTG
tara:strand:- start:105 stop:590 length:486 start_codon:yes stop_codon:yes gene_type:complete